MVPPGEDEVELEVGEDEVVLEKMLLVQVVPVRVGEVGYREWRNVVSMTCTRRFRLLLHCHMHIFFKAYQFLA